MRLTPSIKLSAIIRPAHQEKKDKTEKKAIPSGLTDLVAIQFHSEKTKTHTIHDAISHAVI